MSWREITASGYYELPDMAGGTYQLNSIGHEVHIEYRPDDSSEDWQDLLDASVSASGSASLVNVIVPDDTDARMVVESDGSGHVFWGRVTSLNQSEVKNDTFVSDYKGRATVGGYGLNFHHKSFDGSAR